MMFSYSTIWKKSIALLIGYQFIFYEAILYEALIAYFLNNWTYYTCIAFLKFFSIIVLWCLFTHWFGKIWFLHWISFYIFWTITSWTISFLFFKDLAILNLYCLTIWHIIRVLYFYNCTLYLVFILQYTLIMLPFTIMVYFCTDLELINVVILNWSSLYIWWELSTH